MPAMRIWKLLATAVTALALVLSTGGPALTAPDTVGPARAAAVGTSARICGWGEVCLTLGHAATRRIDGAATEGVLVFAGVLCSVVRPRD